MSESKIVFVLWGGPPGRGLGRALRDPGLHARLAAAGVHRLQLNLDDDPRAGAPRLQTFERPVRAVLGVWTHGPAAAVALTLRAVTPDLAGWRVAETRPLDPPRSYDGARGAARAVVAIVRRSAQPDRPPADPWLARWLDHHTAVALADPATVGYVQNVVTAPVTRGAPPVHAVVEEVSAGSDDDPAWRIARLLDSVATIGGDRDLDLVPTSRCVLALPAARAG